MNQTQEWIEGIVKQFREAEMKADLINLGVAYLRCPYVPEVTAACWREFKKCMEKMAPGEAGKTVVAVDLPAVYYAAFEKNRDDQHLVPGNVRDRIANIYADVAADCKERFFLAIDGEDNWRKKKFPGYKGSRPAKPDGFKETFKLTIDSLQECGYVILQYDDQESDDILASVSYRAKLRRQNAVLVTDDRDTWQCLGTGTVMYSPRSGNYMKDDKLFAEHGIKPQQAVDYLCFVGKNDVPSVNGVGEKRASEYLGLYGNFWGVYDFRSELPQKIRESIEEFAKSNYWLARELHMLNKGLEVVW